MNQQCFGFFLFVVLAACHNIQTVNGGSSFLENLEINLENIKTIYNTVTIKSASSQNGAKVCHREFCCNFKMEGDINDNLNNTNVELFAYSGPATFSGLLQSYVEICGIHKPQLNNINGLSIIGTLGNTNLTTYPLNQKSEDGAFTYQEDIRRNMKYHQSSHAENIQYEINTKENFNSFETFVVFNTNVNMESLQDVNVVLDNVADIRNEIKINEDNFSDYFVTRLQILAFVVTIYCLEQM